MTHLLGLFLIIIALKLVISQNSAIAMSVNTQLDSLFAGTVSNTHSLA